MTETELKARIEAARTAGYLSGFEAGGVHAKADIESKGFRIVPVEPSVRMKGEAWRAFRPATGVSAAEIERMWAAMLAAAKVTP